MKIFEKVAAQSDLIKLNSRLYKRRCSVGVTKSAIGRASAIDLLQIVAEADREASRTAEGKLLICAAMTDVSLDNDAVRFVILAVAEISLVVGQSS